MKLSRSFENQSETGDFDGRVGHKRYQYAIAAHYPVPNTNQDYELGHRVLSDAIKVITHSS